MSEQHAWRNVLSVYAIEAHREMEAYLRLILISWLIGGGWVDPRAGLDSAYKRGTLYLCLNPFTKVQFSGTQPQSLYRLSCPGLHIFAMAG